jgi:hypothetical protein
MAGELRRQVVDYGGNQRHIPDNQWLIFYEFQRWIPVIPIYIYIVDFFFFFKKKKSIPRFKYSKTQKLTKL